MLFQRKHEQYACLGGREHAAGHKALVFGKGRHRASARAAAAHNRYAAGNGLTQLVAHGIGHGTVAHASQHYARTVLYGIAHQINRHARAAVNHVHSRQIAASGLLGKSSRKHGICLAAVIELRFTVDNAAKAARFQRTEGLNIKCGNLYRRAGREHAAVHDQQRPA